MAMNEIKAIVEEGVKVSGRYIFRDDFDNLEAWNVVSGEPTISGSILTLPAGAEVRTKRKWLYGVLVAVAKSSVASCLQIGFHDGGDDYAVWSTNNFRCKSKVTPTEGTTNASITETNWNVFTLLWEADCAMLWVNGSPYAPTQSAYVPNKPLPISIKNVGSGSVQVDVVVLYAEPAGTWVSVGSGSTSDKISLPVNLVGVTSPQRACFVTPFAERMMAEPYTDSTTPLGANASFIGTSRNTHVTNQGEHHEFINAHAVSDQPGTLMIQESPDNSTWVTVKNVQTQQLTNPDGTQVYVALIEAHHITLDYVRVAYRNGANPQTTFRLSSKVYTV